MNSNLSTFEIEESLNNYLGAAGSQQIKQYMLFAAAILIACVVVPVFLIRVIGKYERKAADIKGVPCKAYLFRSTARLGLHYTLIIFLPVLAVRRIYYSLQLQRQYDFYGKWLSLFSIALFLFTLIAVVHLFKFQARGLIETGLVLILDAVHKHCIWLGFAGKVTDSAKGLRAAARYGYYIMADHMFVRSMAADVAAVGVIVFFTLYYYKRRYLFTPEKLHMPKCVYCGKVILKGDDFCTCCGTKLTVNPIEKLIEPLDEVKHCRKCGRSDKDIGCITCDTKEYIEKHIKEKSKEKRVAAVRGSVLTVLFLVCIFIPQRNNSSWNLQIGSAKVNNAFVERWQEFDEQPERAADPLWLAGFDADLNALYIIDSKWYYVEPGMVLNDKLWFYALYAEASFAQMEVLEEISGQVHAIAEGQKVDDAFIETEKDLQTRFNETIMQQEKAGIEYTDAASPWDTVGKFGYLCVDGINYYFHDVSVTCIAIVVLAICAAMFAYMMNSFSNTTETAVERWSRKNGIRTEEYIRRHDIAVQPTVISANIFYRTFKALKSCGYSFLRVVSEIWMLFVRMVCALGLLLSVFRLRNIKRCFRWVKDGLTDDQPARVVGEGDHVAFRRAERKLNIIAIAVSIVLFAAAFAIAFIYNYQEPDKEEQYLQLADDVTHGYSEDIIAAMIRIEDSHTLSDDERKWIYDLFDRQMEADQRILDYDMTELDAYLELHVGLCGLCEDDIIMIQKIKESLENDIVPSRELQREYASLRGENYTWVLIKIAEESLQQTVDAFFDL